MRDYSLTHLSDAALLRDLSALAARERATTAEFLAHIAEVDARRLYVPAGFSSMHAYCVGELRLSEDAAYKRIQAARAGRQFPALFVAVSEGRLHLAAACLLAPHLTSSVSPPERSRRHEISYARSRRLPQDPTRNLPRGKLGRAETCSILGQREARRLLRRPRDRARKLRVGRRRNHGRCRLRRSASWSGSPSTRQPTTSSGMRKPCSVTRFLQETSRKSSEGPSTR
jgi:hypothetical protein